MLRQLGRGGDHGGWLNESIRTVDLPALPELKEGELGSLVVGDWLQMVTPTMRDLSSVSAQWWEQVTNRAMTANQTWLKAEPVQRLYVRPEVPAECTGSWSRLEQRGQIMLLNALPPQLRAEVLANRATGSVDLIYAVLTHYQPGGLAEKARLLRMLVEPAVPKDLGGLLEGLCGWHRSLRRAEELDIATPDPTLLMGALDQMAEVLTKSSTQTTFRLSSTRAALLVDVSPNLKTVLNFSDALLAEAESAFCSYLVDNDSDSTR